MSPSQFLLFPKNSFDIFLSPFSSPPQSEAVHLVLGVGGAFRFTQHALFPLLILLFHSFQTSVSFFVSPLCVGVCMCTCLVCTAVCVQLCVCTQLCVCAGVCTQLCVQLCARSCMCAGQRKTSCSCPTSLCLVSLSQNPIQHWDYRCVMDHFGLFYWCWDWDSDPLNHKASTLNN